MAGLTQSEYNPPLIAASGRQREGGHVVVDAESQVLTVALDDVEPDQVAAVGGKGANLGSLTRLEGVRVPAGFCVTVQAYDRIVEAASIEGPLASLSTTSPDDHDGVHSLAAEIRAAIEQTPPPACVASRITDALTTLGDGMAYAVRSSATTEDLPGASFAGQHDSYLNVIGADAVLDRVRRCWASLFSDRAVAYRMRRDTDPRGVRMAVVVQRMVDADASGVMFTADPVSSNRETVVVESTYGLGEALVSGRATCDAHHIRRGEIIGQSIRVKQTAVRAAPDGGIREQSIDVDLQLRPALSEEQVLELARLGRRIEAGLGCAQDVEWCLVDGSFQIVQSRPITTLFPLPHVDDLRNHVYVSVGHNQMMTDALRPLGLSFWQMTTPAPMTEIGGRLFVDVTARLSTTAGRRGLLEMFGRGDPLVVDALETVISRDDALSSVPDDGVEAPPVVSGNAVDPIPTDPTIVTSLIEQTRTSIERTRKEISEHVGEELFDFIVDDLLELRALLSGPLTHKAALAGMEATWWLNDRLTEWLGDRAAVDGLTQSAPGNVTSEMGLALLEVADAIRPHPQVVAHLDTIGSDDGFLAGLDRVEGGVEARAAIEWFLERYGMRCVGEIDITRPRWAEQPGELVPTILANIENFHPGEGPRRFERGRRRAEATERELLERLRELPDGDRKSAEAKEMIDRLRTFIGFREYPKYGMVSRYLIYKQALLREAERLVQAGVLNERDDAFYLRFEELRDAVRDLAVDQALIDARKTAQQSYEALFPPRVLATASGGENGTYRRDDLPPGALVGLPVSAGVVEGRSRVVTDLAEADLRPGDILVTTHTDPSWSPLFVTIAGLVTEVGGLMTHGAVVAREYGLPAVVGVERATTEIHDGERIRLNGVLGYVELLDRGPEAK